MNELDLHNGTFDFDADLPLASELRAGFPSPAEGIPHESLDFNHDMIRHPESTFYGRVRGDSMKDAGINDGDIAVIDKARTPCNGDIVVAYINNEFTIKYLDTTHQAEGFIELRPANPAFRPIRITTNDEFEVWGVVIYTIKCWAR